MLKEYFRKWFWEAMDDFIDLAYRPPGMDKLKDSDTWQGFRAVLEDEECEEKFLAIKDADRPLEFNPNRYPNCGLGVCFPADAKVGARLYRCPICHETLSKPVRKGAFKHES